MPKRWSKLQKEIEKLFDPKLDMRIQCRRYRMDSRYGSTDLPRYWITLNGKVIFDYPKQFLMTDSPGYLIRAGKRKYLPLKVAYPYSNDISTLSDIIREYIDTPKDALLLKKFEKDKWGLTDILKVADRRLGKKRLLEHFADSGNHAVKEVFASRFGAKQLEDDMFTRDFRSLMDRFHSMLPAQIWLKDDSVIIGYIAEIDIKAGSFNVLGMAEDEFYIGISIADVVGVEDIDYAVEPGKSIVIYVDDVRKGHPDVENEVIVKSVKEAMHVIDYALEVGADIELIDLDHDLGDYEPFGGDAINLVYYLAEKELYHPIAVHSSNPTGRSNIMQVVERYWPK